MHDTCSRILTDIGLYEKYPELFYYRVAIAKFFSYGLRKRYKKNIDAFKYVVYANDTPIDLIDENTLKNIFANIKYNKKIMHTFKVCHENKMIKFLASEFLSTFLNMNTPKIIDQFYFAHTQQYMIVKNEYINTICRKYLMLELAQLFSVLKFIIDNSIEDHDVLTYLNVRKNDHLYILYCYISTSFVPKYENIKGENIIDIYPKIFEAHCGEVFFDLIAEHQKTIHKMKLAVNRSSTSNMLKKYPDFDAFFGIYQKISYPRAHLINQMLYLSQVIDIDDTQKSEFNIPVIQPFTEQLYITI